MMLLPATSLRPFLGSALAALLLGSLPAHAQGPTLTSLSPVRNAVAVPRAGNVALTFSQAISAASASNVRVFSAQRGGQLVRAGGGTVSGGGTSTVTFDPATDFKPGETVMVTVPGTVQGVGGAGVAPHVYQFTAAVGGTGRGNFVAPAGTPEVSVGVVPAGVAMGDVDGDGDLDMLAANWGTVSARGTTVSVRLNNGAGLFGGTQEVITGAQVVNVALGDIDNDGDLDFVTSNFLVNTVSVRLNNGAGVFSGNLDMQIGLEPHAVALADINGDGRLDLLVSHSVSSGTVSVLLNTGAGIFSGIQSVSAGINPLSVTLGDVDGDGDLDLLFANQNDNDVRVRLNDGLGTFSGTHSVWVGGFPQSMALGDLDGDSDLDFVATNYLGNGAVSVRLNDGTGTFSGTSSVSVGSGTTFVALGDVDGDGDLDFVASNSSIGINTVSVRLNGSTGPTGALPGATPAVLTIAPNPAPASAPVRLTGCPVGQPLILLDATGRRVATLQADATGTATLPAAALAPGLYLLRAPDGRTARLVVE